MITLFLYLFEMKQNMMCKSTLFYNENLTRLLFNFVNLFLKFFNQYLKLIIKLYLKLTFEM
jgi:hypothetical protein